MSFKGLLEPEDIYSSVSFYLKNQIINGQNIIVDDGWTL